MFSDTDYSSLLIIEVISFICVPNTKRHSCWRRMLSSLSVTYRSFSSIYKLTNIYSDLLLNSLSAAKTSRLAPRPLTSSAVLFK